MCICSCLCIQIKVEICVTILFFLQIGDRVTCRERTCLCWSCGTCGGLSGHQGFWKSATAGLTSYHSVVHITAVILASGLTNSWETTHGNFTWSGIAILPRHFNQAELLLFILYSLSPPLSCCLPVTSAQAGGVQIPPALIIASTPAICFPQTQTMFKASQIPYSDSAPPLCTSLSHYFSLIVFFCTPSPFLIVLLTLSPSHSLSLPTNTHKHTHEHTHINAHTQNTAAPSLQEI